MVKKIDFHKTLIAWILGLFISPIIIFFLCIKIKVEAFNACFIALIIFVSILLKIALMTTKRYTKKKKLLKEFNKKK